MATILPYLRSEAFGPVDIQAMSLALEEVCNALKVNGDAIARETVAVRIIELAGRGERNFAKIRDRVLTEAGVAIVDGERDRKENPRA